MSAQPGADNLYEARTHIYPRSVSGRFRTLKWSVVIIAYGVYFLLPWIWGVRLADGAVAIP